MNVKQVAVGALTLLALAACSSEGAVKQGPGSTEASPVAVPKDAEPGDFPSFAEPDYTYVYQMSCFCPDWGMVEVKVRDGEVATAKLLQDLPADSAGPAQVPDFLSRTLDELIQEANEAKGPVSFKWPEGQAYPTSLSIDRIPQAVDDEVSYFIFSVEVE